MVYSNRVPYNPFPWLFPLRLPTTLAAHNAANVFLGKALFKRFRVHSFLFVPLVCSFNRLIARHIPSISAIFCPQEVIHRCLLYTRVYDRDMLKHVRSGKCESVHKRSLVFRFEHRIRPLAVMAGGSVRHDPPTSYKHRDGKLELKTVLVLG